MNNGLPTRIRQLVEGQDVPQLQLWYTDILGDLESVTISGGRLDRLFERGVVHNDAHTDGFGQGAGADIVAVPDWTTFKMLPASRRGPKSAAVFCHLESMGFLNVDDRVLM